MRREVALDLPDLARHVLAQLLPDLLAHLLAQRILAGGLLAHDVGGDAQKITGLILRWRALCNARGDQIVEVAIEPPEPRDERTKEILRELSTLHPEDPRSEIWSKV